MNSVRVWGVWGGEQCVGVNSVWGRGVNNVWGRGSTMCGEGVKSVWGEGGEQCGGGGCEQCGGVGCEQCGGVYILTSCMASLKQWKLYSISPCLSNTSSLSKHTRDKNLLTSLRYRMVPLLSRIMEDDC